jgi:hypothetical protein
MPVTVPCGQCIGCRLEYSRQWAMRCMHEASIHDENCFLTLTVSDDHMLPDCSLSRTVFPSFMKRLRKRYGGKKIRYFYCGEYGGKTRRPHYHAILFGHVFEDQKFFKTTDNGHDLYRSDILDSLWSIGHCNIGTVTFESAAYVARYVAKKSDEEGKKTNELYNFETGEIHEREPEFAGMSRRPGIGSEWLQRYGDEVRRHDSVIMRGREMQPPKFYDKSHPSLQEAKAIRKRNARKHSDNNTTDRLAVREYVKKAQMKFLKRN